MYGLNQIAEQTSVLKSAFYQPPTEEEIKQNQLITSLWEYKGALANGESIAALVSNNVISAQEARRILDVDRFLGILEEIESLNKK
jgi:hypothetical protein